jgi:hypothetical protein
MAARLEALTRTVSEIRPCSVRQVYYWTTVRNVVEKTETSYDKVQTALVRLRCCESHSLAWITDNTRWQTIGNNIEGC